jgi:hypothetical protein
MEKKLIKALIGCLFLYSFSVLGQTSEEEYLAAEKVRMEQSEANEADIDIFITTNLPNYNLTQSRIDEVTNNLLSEGITSTSEISAALLVVKKFELRKLYFTTYPNKASLYNAIPIPVEIQQICLNGGFNNNSVAGYTFRSDVGPPGFNGCLTPAAIANTPVPATNNFNSRITRISSINGGYQINDPTLAAFNVNIPTILTGNGSIRLNNMVADNTVNATTMRRVFPVINQGFLDFNFSLILENPGGHTLAEQPFFRARVLDVNGNVVDNICIVSNPANCLFNSVVQPTGTPLLYTGWVCARLNVQSILGQQGTVEFTIGDCGLSGHQGYVYIDNVCGATCPNPAFGSINLNPLNINCPSTPFQVCGTYQTPPNSILGALTLDIMQGTNIVGTINSPTQITGTTFCFTVDPNLYGNNPTGNYTFQVNVTYNVNCGAGIFQYNSSTTNGTVSFNNCCLPNAILLSPNDNVTNLFPLAVRNLERSDFIRASNIIGIGDNVIQNGVVYHAGNFVDLMPGFDAITGSQFAAYPQGCTQNFVYRQPNPNSDNSEIIEPLEINLVKIQKELKIYPNPSNSFIDLMIKNDIFNKIIIVGIDGKIVLDKTIEPTTTFNLDISRYASGIYIVNVISNDGRQYSQKLIKN